MQPRVLKYILDIESAIVEIEDLVLHCGSSFHEFQKQKLAIRSLERLLEIIGEALRKLLEIDPKIEITDSGRIISLRNRLAHVHMIALIVLSYGLLL